MVRRTSKLESMKRHSMRQEKPPLSLMESCRSSLQLNSLIKAKQKKAKVSTKRAYSREGSQKMVSMA